MSLKRQKKKLDYKSAEVQRVISKKLDSFCKYLNSEYHINAGGCCYIAYILASLLKKDGFRYKLVIWSDDPINKTFTKIKTSNFHYGILLGGCFINGNRCHNDRTLFETFYSRVKVTDILKHYNEKSWNNYYDRKQNSFILKMITIFYDNLTEGLRKRPEYCLRQ